MKLDPMPYWVKIDVTLRVRVWIETRGTSTSREGRQRHPPREGVD